MPEVLTNTPNAYEAVIVSPSARRVDSPEAFAKLRDEVGEDPARLAEFDQQITNEEAFFGVIAATDPEEFFRRRTEFMQTEEVRLAEMFPQIKKDAITGYARYLAEGDISAYDELIGTFTDRLRDVNTIVVDDPLLVGFRAKFYESSRKIGVTASALMEVVAGTHDEQDYLKDTVIAHELGHSMMTASLTVDAIDYAFTTLSLHSQNGLRTRHLPNDNQAISSLGEVISHGEWLNEAKLEDIRSKAMSTQYIGYKMGVSVLRTLEALMPGLSGILAAAQFKEVPKSRAIAAMEELLGPMGVEKVGELLPKATKDDPSLEKAQKCFLQIATLLPAEVQQGAVQGMMKEWKALCIATKPIKAGV